MTAVDHQWFAIPAGEYEIGLREEAARSLAVLVAQQAREAAEADPDQINPEREASDLAQRWGNPDYLYAQLAHSMPAHLVRLEAFSIGTTPVTLRDWTAFRIATGGVPRATWDMPGQSRAHSADEPVTGLSWSEAQAFAAWRQSCLPREAEWEVAMRAMHPSLAGMGHGLFEWCADPFEPYPGADERAWNAIDHPPKGWSGTRTRRAGAIPGFPISVVTRRGADPTQRLRDTTFRLVRRK